MDDTEKEIFQRLVALEEAIKALNKLQDVNDRLVKSVYEMSIELKNVREDLTEMTGAIEEIKSKPAKRWESAIAAIIGAVTGGIGTAIITKLIGG